MYTQQAPLPVHASLLSPEILASKNIQLTTGGIDLITKNIISNDKTALKLLVLIFLFNKSNCFIPEYSILIKCKPIKPKTNGKTKPIDEGKNEVKFKLKNEFKNTSKTLIKNKKIPVYKYLYKLSLLGDKKLIFFITFL